MATPRFAPAIDATVRARGERYYQEGRAHFLGGDSGGATYRVSGTREYVVVLATEGEALACACDCPYFTENKAPCKHIWAALLAAQADGQLERMAAATAPKTAPPPKRAGRPASWRRLVGSLSDNTFEAAAAPTRAYEEHRILPVIDLERSLERGGLSVRFDRETRRPNGTWANRRVLSITFGEAAQLPDAADRMVFGLLRGTDENRWGYVASRDSERLANPAVVPPETTGLVLEQLAATGRCVVVTKFDAEPNPLRVDPGPPWRFALEVRPVSADGEYIAGGVLLREGESIPLERPDLFLASGVFFEGGLVSRIDTKGTFTVLAALRAHGTVRVPRAESSAFVGALLKAVPNIEARLPEELRFSEIAGVPQPAIRIEKPPGHWDERKLTASATFEYPEGTAEALSGSPVFVDVARKQLVRRDAAAESEAVRFLEELGFRKSRFGYARDPVQWELLARRLPAVVPELLRAGWRVEAEGRLYRRARAVRAQFTSGIDWFELQGAASYGDEEVPLPRLLAALRKGEATVLLGDGSLGILPEEWLARYAGVAGLGEATEDRVKFRQNQLGFLDALLATLPEASCDALFAQARKKLRAFDGVRALEPSAGFRGTLRPYQKEGLGWFRFLREFGFGGCLADDMGLGKTVQVLALLEARRVRRGAEEKRPSLVVAPRSLIFNWIEEAGRFTPSLRVLDYTGFDRARSVARFAEHDLVLTTYGTLRRDAAILKRIDFDYVVLDEAQSIKNARSHAAKAVRLLSGRHRLALSGTPIENHIGELWSLFDFLNPGMLGASPAFRLGTEAQKNPQGEECALLARALRPFILRRTKEQVAKELPARTDLTLVCELGAEQRSLYEEVREHYRRSLLEHVDQAGLGKSGMEVLEALLRLRQAAIHPALLDAKREHEPSAKLDLLEEQLEQVLEEGHKALVFSQFTTLLALLRRRLDAAGVKYAYLDGQTPAPARKAEVARFQNDAECPLFLLSLKAGGLGLNLTAAEYVYLLDPWWNPAVEAQAVDRAHRIGQRKPVFAYRLVAANTIEDKILALQASKRALADAILVGDGSVLRGLTREDLEALLG